MGKFGATELLILLIPVTVIYFIPAIIGFSRNHPNKVGIFLLNLFLGWTFLGWLGAFIWSLVASTRQTVVVNNHFRETNNSPAQKQEPAPKAATQKTQEQAYDEKLDRLQKLKQLLDSGILSEEEFALEKSKILNG